MVRRSKFVGQSILIGLFLSFLGIFAPAGQALSQDVDSQCLSAKDKWEQIHQDFKDKLNSFVAIQQLPVEKVTSRPLVTNSTGKSMARQISEALQAKDDVLNIKRTECRNLMNLENQAFSELQDCISSVKNTKNKDLTSLHKKRRAVLDKASLALTEVKEVEGRETILPYSEVSNDPYSRSVNNYWRSYEQMYRRWGGY